jgi:hypothetical protein
VSKTDLVIAPFNLPWGSSIYATITAANIVGDSLASEPGNGAIILTNPDAPLNLANDPAITTANQIAITWNEGTNDGGSPVVDYTISYKEQNSIDGYEEDTGVPSSPYTITGLTQGITYQVKIQGRNEYGLSDFSDEITVLVAQIPD